MTVLTRREAFRVSAILLRMALLSDRPRAKFFFKHAWTMFWFATGSSKIGVTIQADGVEYVGAALIEENE